MARKLTRREFVAASASAGAVLLWPGRRVLGANERINVAIMGCGNKGSAHVTGFGKIPGVRVAAVCDPDIRRARAGAKKVEPAAAAVQDFRRILDDKRIDAVVIATPNHWHAPMTILACKAGKHVYVEKPVSHCIREGRRMVEVAHATGRLVQAGTQQRSDPAIGELTADLQSGVYGKVLWVHCSRLVARQPIGKVTAPTPVPNYIDYNLWAGPAPMTPVMRKRFHYDWHWQWNWGNGEVGNWGIHYIDDALNFLRKDTVPKRVVVAGRRFAWDDDGQTPNMHLALFDLEGLPLVVDIRNLPDLVRPAGHRPGGKSGAVYLRMRHGNFIMCEHAYIRFARGGGKAYDRKTDQPIKHYKGTGGSGHDVNFIHALRSGRRSDLHAEIAVSHRSTILCHQANIGFRIGAAAPVEQVRESVRSHADALHTLTDMVEQLDGNGVDLEKTPFVLGPQLTFDPAAERFTGEHADAANRHLSYAYREPFARMIEG